jgi:hypothetical protein
MNELKEKIHIQYLQEEIYKMQKTANCLKKMIDDKDPERDQDLINSLKTMRSTTLNSIENKQRELKNFYNNKINSNNN